MRSLLVTTVRAELGALLQALNDFPAGTWIAHPLINKIAMEVFDKHMLGPNQVKCSFLSMKAVSNHA